MIPLIAGLTGLRLNQVSIGIGPSLSLDELRNQLRLNSSPSTPRQETLKGSRPSITLHPYDSPYVEATLPNVTMHARTETGNPTPPAKKVAASAENESKDSPSRRKGKGDGSDGGFIKNHKAGSASKPVNKGQSVLGITAIAAVITSSVAFATHFIKEDLLGPFTKHIQPFVDFIAILLLTVFCAAWLNHQSDPDKTSIGTESASSL